MFRCGFGSPHGPEGRPFPEWEEANAGPGDNRSGDSHSAFTPVPKMTPTPIGQLTPVLCAGQ